MTVRARYVHTNLVVRDWEKLVGFYRDVFGCTPATPGAGQPTLGSRPGTS